MSSDPESRQISPELRPPPVTTTPSQPPAAANDVPRTPPREVGYVSEECRTPTGPEHRIPDALVCPPPPSKKRRTMPPPPPVRGSRKSRDVPRLYDDLSWEVFFERMFPLRIESESKNWNSKRRSPYS